MEHPPTAALTQHAHNVSDKHPKPNIPPNSGKRQQNNNNNQQQQTQHGAASAMLHSRAAVPTNHLTSITPKPWHKHVPDRLLQRLLPAENPAPTTNDYNLPTGYIVLVLSAGKDDHASTMAAIQQTAPWLTPYVVEVELDRDPQRHNVLLDQPYSQILRAANEGRILAVIGGPNCRTWSIRLHYPQRDGTPGQPMRGCDEQTLWGLPTNTTDQQQKTDDDSMLLLRMLHIMDVATDSGTTPRFFLEHPSDPAGNSPHPNAHNCSTIWAVNFMQQFMHYHSLHKTTFAQCNLGNPVDKLTTAAHNLANFRQYDGWLCEHG
jgi:hypothetical protein